MCLITHTYVHTCVSEFAKFRILSIYVNISIHCSFCWHMEIAVSFLYFIYISFFLCFANPSTLYFI